MRYEKARDQFDRYRTADWEHSCRYLEIAGDSFSSRQVDVCSNGNCLRYDRSIWVDEFGMLGEARHSPEYASRCQQQWAVEEITRDEFEAVRKASDTAPNQPQKYDASCFGQVPQGLVDEMTPERIERLPPWIK
jgi:hypothetical protein